ncbi:MAG: DNA repair protein RecN, partial [Flavobacteriaceae bacterium]
ALSTYKKTTQEYTRLHHQENQSKESLEYKQFLFDELQSAKLEVGIYEKWEEQYTSLTHIDYLQNSLAEAIQLIENESLGILDQLFRVRSLANGLEEKSKQFLSLSNRFRSLTIEMEDVNEECKQQLENLEANPQEMEILQQKMDLVHSLFQKHKVQTVSELIEIQEQLEKDLEQTADLEETLKKLKAIQLRQEQDLIRLSDILTQNRKKATFLLEAELVGLVNQMGMENARFKIDLSPSEDFLFNGKDQLSFMFSANTGGEFQLLKKVASGGELSRIMLSIKAVLSRYKKLPTLIVDEIDTGVSG